MTHAQLAPHVVNIVCAASALARRFAALGRSLSIELTEDDLRATRDSIRYLRAAIDDLERDLPP